MIHINPEPAKCMIPDRALRIAKAILAHRSQMKSMGDGLGELRVGLFTVLHAPPEAYANGPWHNVNIWRQGETKLANIEWNEAEGFAVVGIISFRQGAWERELINLLGDADFEFTGGG